MYLAKHKHEGEAASWAGNSPNVIHKSYKGLVKEADANYLNLILSELGPILLGLLWQDVFQIDDGPIIDEYKPWF